MPKPITEKPELWVRLDPVLSLMTSSSHFPYFPITILCLFLLLPTITSVKCSLFTTAGCPSPEGKELVPDKKTFHWAWSSSGRKNQACIPFKIELIYFTPGVQFPSLLSSHFPISLPPSPIHSSSVFIQNMAGLSCVLKSMVYQVVVGLNTSPWIKAGQVNPL